MHSSAASSCKRFCLRVEEVEKGGVVGKVFQKLDDADLWEKGGVVGEVFQKLDDADLWEKGGVVGEVFQKLDDADLWEKGGVIGKVFQNWTMLTCVEEEHIGRRQ
ncbi:hypothetical protein BDY21DRAFT_404105 [Lineolata rhizophorae]|uniref:Uncharacterized protein n=1 Tax=Lineolata rhizophorae TaxID=578093 RepID=A0A6A6NP37_9PEZI|nr:hypothetical protein BDY21DRAFT_404105 [Lineolata rhizophorae]